MVEEQRRPVISNDFVGRTDERRQIAGTRGGEDERHLPPQPFEAAAAAATVVHCMFR